MFFFDEDKAISPLERNEASTGNRTDFEEVRQQEKSAGLLHKRLFKKLPNKHLRAYDNIINKYSTDEDEYYYRCRLFQDYISGMTDQFAYDEYRALMISD